MPELPEVETIRRDLEKKILNKKITDIKIFAGKTVGGNHHIFSSKIIGNYFVGVDRRGKLLIFRLRSGDNMLVHLKMTGQLIYEFPRGKEIKFVFGGHQISREPEFILCLPDIHTRVIFTFADRSVLFFNDLRRFGYIKLATHDELEKIEAKYGLEPLSSHFTYKNFVALLAKKKTNLKAFLMNQEMIAGLGNIYADEVCYCAGVLPWRPINKLKPAEIKKIYSCIPKILRLSLKHRGTTFSNYLDSAGKKGNFLTFLKVYDRDGEKCGRCDAIIKKTRHAGRGTHYCASCQK